MDNKPKTTKKLNKDADIKFLSESEELRQKHILGKGRTRLSDNVGIPKTVGSARDNIKNYVQKVKENNEIFDNYLHSKKPTTLDITKERYNEQIKQRDKEYTKRMKHKKRLYITRDSEGNILFIEK